MTCIVLLAAMAAMHSLEAFDAQQSQAVSEQEEIAALVKIIEAQQQRLRQQKQEIEAIRTEIANEEQRLKSWLALRSSSPSSSSGSSAQKPPAAPKKPTGIRIPVFIGQEIATAGPDAPSFKLGPADIRIQGYVGVSGLFRSASMGGGPGTSFASVPLVGTAPANATELRATTQTSRLALRIDVPFTKDRMSGYVEADFSGATPGNALVSSSSYGFRVRHSWISVRRGKLEVAAGQMFSLMTPSRADVQTWSGDALTTQVVDTNYVAGLVWDRAPGVRVVYRPNKSWNFAASIENPEQQVGSSVRFPSTLSAVLSNQYNTGRGELRTPNAAPDTVLKAAWNGAIGKRNLHIDTGTVLRFFRSLDPSDIRSHKTALGIGANLNFSFDLVRKLRLIGQGFLSSGGGRYIGGFVPDVIVRADGEISPIKAHSWVSGLEFSATRRLSFYGYYSGFYGTRNTTIDSNGMPVGFGFAGSTSARRAVQEWSTGWSQTLWSGEDAGSLQYATQYSWLKNSQWWNGNNPGGNSVHMVLYQFRYNLP